MALQAGARLGPYMRILTFGAAVIALLLPAPTVQATQSTSSGATISGRVIDGGTQVPIAGARLVLLPAPTGRPTGPMGPPAQVMTGDDGVYTFSGVAAGRYRLQVQKIGFVAPNAAQTLLLEVGSGQSLAGPDFRLSKGAAISGRVVDARGEPLAGMIVQALHRPVPTGARGRGRRMPALPGGQPGQTNDIGEFRVTGLEAGDYYVAASPQPRSPLEQSSSGGTTPITTYYAGSSELTGAQVITVAAGQTVGGLDIMMMTARGFAISGIVVDEMNRPIAGAMVRAMPAQATVVGLSPRGSSRTQPDGTFTVGDITPGTYRLTASVPVTISSGSSGVGSVSFSSSSSSGPPTMVQITVGDADVGGVTVVVRKSGQE